MRCPKCGCTDDKVVETRVTRDGEAIRRRRQCDDCSFRFTTRETVLPADIIVVKRDGRREEFSPEKLRAGIRHACWKRSVSEEMIDDLVSQITAKVMELQEREVQSLAIGELTMEALQKVDEVAYVRFASIYRRFKDIDQFINEVNSLSGRQAAKDGRAGGGDK